MRRQLELSIAVCRRHERRACAALLTALLLAAAIPVLPAQSAAAPAYIQPPSEIKELFDRDKHYDTLNRLSPEGEHFLIPVESELSTLKLMAQKTYRLAMLELTPETDRLLRHSTWGIRGLKFYSLAERRSRTVQLPPETIVSDMTWSPDGNQLAFLAHLPAGTQLWVADARTAQARPFSEARVMATLAAERPRSRGPRAEASQMIQWTPDGGILTLLVPEGRGPEPKPDPVPPAPRILTTGEKAQPTTTLPFLLKTRHDSELFQHFTTAQLTLLMPGRPAKKLGPPAMYLEVSLSPDGRHILAERIVEPFSNMVSYSNFGTRLEVLDLEGTVVSTVRVLPLRETSARVENRPEEDLPRDVAWRPDGRGLSFLWLEKRPEGPTAEVEASSETTRRKDRLFHLEPPFDMQRARALLTSDKRLSEVSYAADGRYAFATLTERAQGRQRQEIVAWDLSAAEPRQHVLAREHDPEDMLKLPGEILTRSSGNGIPHALLTPDGVSTYLQGSGYQSDYRPRPFIDRVAIAGGEKQRVFEGSAELFEQPLVPLDNSLSRLVISRESRSLFPDSFLRGGDGSLARLTGNSDPFPEITAARRVDFEFTRRDGTHIQGHISLPVGYREGTRVPAMFWTYPREYADQQEYARDAIRTRNRNAFNHLSYLRWSEIWLARGYALVHPDVPILGRSNEYNNNYIPHLVDTLYAAIRKVDEMGFVDIDRIGHGGHSYGAFATANLLAHSPFFKAGIAGDGAYNRTLTPMTFQRERRFLWEARTTYLEMSPFFYADRINTPLLMYHGEEDDNSGTFLIQSERLLQALAGLGKKAVLYIYPFESHSPRAKESYLDLWARWIDWFDHHVKNAEAKKATQDGNP